MITIVDYNRSTDVEEREKTPMELLDSMEVQEVGQNAEKRGFNIPYELVNRYRAAATRMKMSTDKRFSSSIIDGGILIWRTR